MNMNRYFTEERKISIVKQLQQNNGISLAEMAEKLNVSTRTIRNDLKLINEELEDAAFIELEQGNCYLYITNRQKLEQKKTVWQNPKNCFDSPQKRAAYIMKTLISHNKPYSTEELAYEMNLGRTTLSLEIKKLNAVLKNYGLCIVGMQNAGITWKGEELHLRFFILKYIYEFIYEQDALQEQLCKNMKKMLEKYSLESITEESFFRCIVIAVDRIKSGNSLKKLDEKFYMLKQSDVWNITNEIAKKLEPLLGICFTEEEKLFMTIPLAGMRTPTDLESISKMQFNQNVEEIIDEIIEKIGYELNLYLKKENLQKDFFYHISFLVNRLHFGYMLKNPISEEIRKKYPLAYKMAKIAGRVIEKRYHVTVPQDELGYIAAYFGVYILEYSISQQKPYKIALVCSTGRGTARLIASQLKKLLDHNAVMDLFSEKQVTAELLDNYDIVFSTIALSFEMKKQIIYIKDIFDEKELLSHIKKVKYLEKINFLGTETAGTSLIASLLEEDRFFLLDEKKGYLENTEMMIQHLIKEEYVDKGFLERIKKREQNSTMVFGNLVAFPHAVNKQRQSNLVLALGVCPQKLASQKQEQVQLIFLLALPQSHEMDDSVLVRIYDEMISIAQNEEYTKEIVKVENYKQLVRCFVKLGIGKLL